MVPRIRPRRFSCCLSTSVARRRRGRAAGHRYAHALLRSPARPWKEVPLARQAGQASLSHCAARRAQGVDEETARPLHHRCGSQSLARRQPVAARPGRQGAFHRRRRGPSRSGQHDDFAKHLRPLPARDPVFRGIRINHDELKRGLEQKKFLDNLRLLVTHDRTLDVNGGPDMPADVARLAQAIPELRIVINHAANVTIDGKAPPVAWLKGMRAAAAGKNVFCKVSALVEGTRRYQGRRPRRPSSITGPILDALVGNSLGEDRLIYGSNWPVCEQCGQLCHGCMRLCARISRNEAMPQPRSISCEMLRRPIKR